VSAAGPAGLAYDVERTSVRVVLRDGSGRLLLFSTVDPEMPETGAWWELPGGGMEPGESWADTACREIAEETGLRLSVEQIGEPRWTRTATYLRRHRRVLQHELVVVADLDVDEPRIARDGRTAEELEEYVASRWWAPEEVAASAERFFPGSLPALLPRLLAGERIDEPFEFWN
jgi:8-oxo-dGTP pyrophosphatase MutT (NUDIX family)